MGGRGSGTPNAALLRLDGIQIAEDGKVSKTDFFKFLDLPAGDYTNLEKTMTPEQALKFRNHVVRMKYGTAAAIPLLCAGRQCPVKQCPFHSGENWPISEPCPIEGKLISMWMRSYMEDLGIDPENITEMVLINKVVEADIIDYRINIALSGGNDKEASTLLKTDTVETEHATSTSTNIHPLLDIKEKYHKIRQSVLETFAATRREKYKRAAALKKREDEDVSTHMADLKKTINKLNQIKEGKTLEDIDEEIKGLEEIKDADWESIS